MNRTQKAATAVIALIITVLGATVVNAPLVLAHSQPVAVHHQLRT
ncbi:MAG: hypothetical protein ACREUL_06565 [Steroidobacteraceae bacterium]